MFRCDHPTLDGSTHPQLAHALALLVWDSKRNEAWGGGTAIEINTDGTQIVTQEDRVQVRLCH